MKDERLVRQAQGWDWGLVLLLGHRHSHLDGMKFRSTEDGIQSLGHRLLER